MGYCSVLSGAVMYGRVWFMLTKLFLWNGSVRSGLVLSSMVG